jgi:hypothetical protein
VKKALQVEEQKLPADGAVSINIDVTNNDDERENYAILDDEDD